MGYPQASHLLELVVAFACPEHFIALKEAITHYCMLAPEGAVQASLDMSSHLYMIGIWTECLELINVTLQCFVHTYFTSLIKDGISIIQDRVLQKENAVIKFIKIMVIKIYSKMNEWDSSTNSDQKFTFWAVYCNL